MADLVERDLRCLWHPFTQHAGWPADEPLVIDYAQGPWLYDVAGRRYLDGVSSLWVSVHGHREPAIDAAIRSQLDKVAHTTFLGLTHEPGIRLAEALLASAPAGLTRVFYAGDGSSAVEAALKMAYQAAAQRGEDRPLFVHLAESYHGDTLGAVSVGGIPTFHAAYRQLLFRTREVSSPGRARAGQSLAGRAAEVLDELARVFDEEGPHIAAVVLEPLVQAAAGILTYDPSVLVGARELCDRAGALLLVDEVATGFGRTGRMWAVEHAGVRPDLLTCGKGLTGGYLPLSAVLASEPVFEAFLGSPAENRTFFHGHTYTANPLACAAALANLELMDARATVAAAAALGARLGAGLARLQPLGAQVRRVGAMVGIDLGEHDPAAQLGAAVCRAARKAGVLLRPLGDVVVLMPPLGLTAEQADFLLEVTGAAVTSVLGARA